MVVDVRVQFEHPQLEIDSIHHRNEAIVVAWGPSRPILAEVREHVDMLSEEIHNRFAEAGVKVPLSTTVPFEWGRHCTSDLKGDR